MSQDCDGEEEAVQVCAVSLHRLVLPGVSEGGLAPPQLRQASGMILLQERS